MNRRMLIGLTFIGLIPGRLTAGDTVIVTFTGEVRFFRDDTGLITSVSTGDTVTGWYRYSTDITDRDASDARRGVYIYRYPRDELVLQVRDHTFRTQHGSEHPEHEDLAVRVYDNWGDPARDAFRMSSLCDDVNPPAFVGLGNGQIGVRCTDLTQNVLSDDSLLTSAPMLNDWVDGCSGVIGYSNASTCSTPDGDTHVLIQFDITSFGKPCGNGMREAAEDCDGGDDAACPLDCRRDCTCSAEPDNCPGIANPLRSDIDGDGLGDVCDPCPGVPCHPSCPTHQSNECDSDGSAALECSAVGACCVRTPEAEPAGFPPTARLQNSVEICVPKFGLSNDETISITQIPIIDPQAEVTVGPILERDWGELIAVYRFDPDGTTFDPPATIMMIHDVTDIDSALWTDLAVYVRPDPASSFSSTIPCGYPVEDFKGFYTTCTGTIESFSEYALIAPLDSDDDGVPDKFDGVVDNCPTRANGRQTDWDGDGLGNICDLFPMVDSDDGWCGAGTLPMLPVLLTGLGIMGLVVPRVRQHRGRRSKH